MTSIHRIDNPQAPSTLPGNAGAAPSQNYLGAESVDDTLLRDLLNRCEKVPPNKALPELPQATTRYTTERSEDLVAIPSMGASMMEAIVSMASLMRRQNAELRAHEVTAMAAQIESQASSLRTKADYIRNCGIIAGAMNIVAGVASIGLGVKMSTKLGTAIESEFAALNQRFAAMNTGINASLGGAASTTQSMGQSWATAQDAAIKQSEAVVERTRARMEFMKSLEDSMREVIAKAIATQDAIQQNTNQTRSKILG